MKPNLKFVKEGDSSTLHPFVAALQDLWPDDVQHKTEMAQLVADHLDAKFDKAFAQIMARIDVVATRLEHALDIIEAKFP